MKVQLDKDTLINIVLSDDKGKILFSTKMKGQSGKIFLSTLELERDQVDLIISELVTLRANLIRDVK